MMESGPPRESSAHDENNCSRDCGDCAVEDRWGGGSSMLTSPTYSLVILSGSRGGGDTGSGG